MAIRFLTATRLSQHKLLPTLASVIAGRSVRRREHRRSRRSRGRGARRGRSSPRSHPARGTLASANARRAAREGVSSRCAGRTRKWCALARSFGVGTSSDQVVAAARDSACGKPPRMARLLAVYRSGVRRVGRVHRPWKLRDQHPRRRGLGYRLLWVVVLANLMAMLFQGSRQSSASRPEKPRGTLPRARARAVRYAMWVVSEFGAMATDLAEFLGAIVASLALPHSDAGRRDYHRRRYLHDPLAATATVFARWRRSSARSSALSPSVTSSKRCWRSQIGTLVLYHSVVPWLGGTVEPFIAVGIVGATVMPHAIYLHSALPQDRVVPENPQQARAIVRFSYIDVIIALAIAGLVNLAMMYMAAAVFHATGHASVADIATAYRTLTPLLGNLAAVVFLVSLLASGISSSVVGTMAGQVIMQSFVGFAVPLWVRRLVTMFRRSPSSRSGLNVTQTLIVSQVVLSFVLPVPVIALVLFTIARRYDGRMVNPRWVTRFGDRGGRRHPRAQCRPHLDALHPLDRLQLRDPRRRRCSARGTCAKASRIRLADISIHAAASPSSAFLTVAGAPAATTRGGIAAFCPTTLPAAIKAPSPIVDPLSSVALLPISA